jgi:hypothetical protein
MGLAALSCATGGPLPFLPVEEAPPVGVPSTTGTIRHDAGVLGTVPDAASPLEGCATATDDVQRSPIAMLIVLDASGSMLGDDKWTAVVPALEGFIDDVRQRADPSFGVGLTIFSDTNDATQGKGPYPAMDVPIAYVDAVQAARLHGRLDAAQPAGPTPTLAVLLGQYGALESFVAAPPLDPAGKKVVVLITDGVPYPNPDEQKAAVIKAAGLELTKAAPLGPITTFAVGVGYTFPYDPEIYDQMFMGNLAVAGGAPNLPCDPNELTIDWNMCHFQITPSGQPNSVILEEAFRSAIDKIRSRVTSCDLKIQSEPGSLINPHEVNVTFTDSVTGVVTLFDQDIENGWTYDDPSAPTEVMLHGTACKALQDDPDGAVRVVLGCATQVK